MEACRQYVGGYPYQGGFPGGFGPAGPWGMYGGYPVYGGQWGVGGWPMFPGHGWHHHHHGHRHGHHRSDEIQVYDDGYSMYDIKPYDYE